MAENAAVKFLRKEVAKNKIDEGTVVTFNRAIHTEYDPMRQREFQVRPDEGKIITYAALFVGDRWYLTGKGRLGNEALVNRDFIERLSRSDISDIRVATAFEPVS